MEAPVEARFSDDTAKGAAHRVQRANHTGAEALLQADIEDLRAVLKTNPPAASN
jgi:hypothetical protein